MTCNFEREDPIERLVATGFDAARARARDLGGRRAVPDRGRGARDRDAARERARSALAASRSTSSARSSRRAQSLTEKDRETRAYVGELGEPIRYGSDDILPLLYECGFRWVRSLDFNELALEMLGDYQRDRQFRFQHLALAAVRTPVAGWP